MRGQKIIIAGAGIGGLTVAALLRKKGWDVEVIERRRQEWSAEKGTALNIWSNAVKALERVGVGQTLAERGFPIKRQTIFSWKGTLLMDTPVAEISRQSGAPSVNIRRYDLLELLRAECQGVPIHLGQRCVGYKQEADGVRVHLENGEELHADALIGADGLRSAVRAQLLNDGEPDYLGYTIWRGISEGPGIHEKGELAMYWGPRGVNGGCWWVDEEHVSWTLGKNTPAGGRDEPGRVKMQLLEMVADFPAPLRTAIRQTPEERIFRTDGYARSHTDRWGEGRVTLLGDAAHAMPTIYGQGACQAIEDAVVLADSLTEAKDLVSGLRHYEKRRQERMNWVHAKVMFGTRMQAMENPLLLWLKNVYVKRFFPQKANVKTWKRLLAFNDEGIQLADYEK